MRKMLSKLVVIGTLLTLVVMARWIVHHTLANTLGARNRPRVTSPPDTYPHTATGSGLGIRNGHTDIEHRLGV